MELTSRQRRMLAEAGMSRRQFLKLTGKAAAAAANPQMALKGLAGSLTPSIPGARVAIAIRPESDDLFDLGKALGGIQSAYNAAKKVGDGKVGGAAEGCGSEFEMITFGNMDTINQLIKSGKLKQVTVKGETTTLDKFGKPLSPEETARITQQATQEALKHLSTDPYRGMSPKKSPMKDMSDAEVKKYVDRWVDGALETEVGLRSELRFHDDEGNNYWVTADNDVMGHKTEWFKQVVGTNENRDPFGDWWEMYFGYTDFSDIEFSKPALEFIKQKGLYRRVDDPFGMRKLMDAFEKFNVAPPPDIHQVIEKFKKRPKAPEYEGHNKWSSEYDDIKPGEDWHDYSERKETEEQSAKLKQKEEFEKASPPSDEPDAWRTQSVEFESRLRRLVR